MKAERIDFISAYCDRWCERCPFTDRCSAYACHVAIAMCGDAREGMELAVGAPQPVEGERPETVGETLLAEGIDVELSPEEMAEFERDEKARDTRLDAHPCTGMATQYTLRATSWLKEHGDLLTSGDPVVKEAVEIVGWDAYLIGAKVHRALDGRDRAEHDDEEDDDPVQNDWNGSAKVALISVRRSEAAWGVIAQAIADPVPATLAAELGDLGRVVLERFPRALSFIRPGFDEPWR